MALLREFRRAMGDLEVTGKILAADVTDASAAFRRADVGVLVPHVDTVEYMPALLDACKAHDVGLLIPVTDIDIRALSRHRQKLADVGCKVMVGPPETILKCRDKVMTNELLAALALPTIRTFTLAQFKADPFFPCFVKPIRGSAGEGAGVLHSEAELAVHLATYGELMLVQDYVPGAEYTLDIYRSGDGAVRCVVPRQRLAIRTGEVEKGLTVHDEELIAAGVRLGEALDGIWGVINAQCRRPPGEKAHFFEVNPRFGGGCPLAIAAGADLPRYTLEEALGLPISAELGKFKANLLMLRYDEAVFVEADDPTSLPGFDTPQERR